MNISKTMFINYLRCNRYCALQNILVNSNNLSIDNLIELEKKSKELEIKKSILEENGINLESKLDEKLEVMLPYYRKVEALAANAASNLFKKNVKFSLDTFSQKSFSFSNSNHNFYCFLDCYLENDDGSIIVIECKATTAKKFRDLKYKSNKVEESLFCLKDNILVLSETLDFFNNYDKTKYLDYKKKLFDKENKCGKYIYDLAFQRFVIENYYKSSNKLANIKNNKYYLAVLNDLYVYDGEIKNNERVYKDDIICFIDVTNLTKELMTIISNDLKTVINRINKMDDTPCLLGSYCARKKTTECQFFDLCFKNLPKKNSIFSYLDSNKGFLNKDCYSLINSNILLMKDLPKNYITRKNNVIQREVIDTNTTYIDYDKINKGLSKIKYPIYHLDFESFPCPLPRFKGEKPYTQSLFQFSLHIENRCGLTFKDDSHYEFLAKSSKDEREALASYLVELIKDDDGSVLVYNDNFEKQRLEELSNLFPSLKSRLLNIKSRCFDLLDVIKTNSKFYLDLSFDKERAKTINFYHEALDGSFSIKKVLPIFTNLSYKDLNVHDGTEALVTYANYDNMTKEELEVSRNNLLEYCKQDTWSMVLILQALKKLCKNKEGIKFIKDFNKNLVSIMPDNF